jgi:hypothetical protein
MRIYKRSNTEGKYRIYNAVTKEEILEWSWFDSDNKSYGISHYPEEPIEKETIFDLDIEVVEQNTENFVYFVSSFYRHARRGVEEMEKEMGNKVVYRRFVGDMCQIKVKTDNGVTNYIGLPSSDTNLDFIKKEIRKNPTSFAMIKNEKVVA